LKHCTSLANVNNMIVSSNNHPEAHICVNFCVYTDFGNTRTQWISKGKIGTVIQMLNGFLAQCGMPLGNRRQLVNRDREVAKLQASNWVRSMSFSHFFSYFLSYDTFLATQGLFGDDIDLEDGDAQRFTLLQSSLACERKRLWLVATFSRLSSPILPQKFAGVIADHGTIPCCFGWFTNEVCYPKLIFLPVTLPRPALP
jgi:hypothetical protein